MDGFTGFPNCLLASEAALTLQPSHFMVLVVMAMHLGRIGSKKNGKLAFPNRAGCPWWDHTQKKWVSRPVLHFTKSTTGAALRELEARGLIQCTKRYGFDQKRKAKEYRLTWIKTEEGPATNEWLNYKHPIASRPTRGSGEKARPTSGPVSTIIGRPVGQASPDAGSEAPLQADHSAYLVSHRPTSGPHCYHVIGGETGLAAVKPRAARAPKAQRASTAALKPADTPNNLLPSTEGPGGAAVIGGLDGPEEIAASMQAIRNQVLAASGGLQ